MPSAEATISITDEGLVRGDGVFEVIRVYDGQPFALEEHLRRLERSALNLRLPLDLEAVRAEAHRLLAHAGAGPDHEALRIVVTRGGRRLLLTEPLPGGPRHIRQVQPISAIESRELPAPGEVTSRIAAAVAARIRRELDSG